MVSYPELDCVSLLGVLCDVKCFSANKSQNNICIFSLLGQDVVATFTQGSFENWRPQFSDDEKVCCKLLKETAVFYVDGDFGV